MCTETLYESRGQPTKGKIWIRGWTKYPLLHLRADSDLLFWDSLLANLCFCDDSASLVSLCVHLSAPEPSLSLSCPIYPSSAPCSLQWLFQTLKCILVLLLERWMQPETPTSPRACMMEVLKQVRVSVERKYILVSLDARLIQNQVKWHRNSMLSLNSCQAWCSYGL